MKCQKNHFEIDREERRVHGSGENRQAIVLVTIKNKETGVTFNDWVRPDQLRTKDGLCGLIDWGYAKMDEKCDGSLPVTRLKEACKDKGITGYTKLRKADLVKKCCDGTGTGGVERCYIPDDVFKDGMDGIPARVENPLPAVTGKPSMPASYGRKLEASRKETNDFLRKKGYTWRKEGIYVDGGLASMYPDLERYDGDFANVWALKHPDGRTICYGYDPDCDRKYQDILVENGFYGDEAIAYENELREHEQSLNNRKRESRDRVSMIKNYFKDGYRDKTFERPEKMEAFPRECFHPNGKGFNVYGGGEEFVVTNKGIWDIENNGMDGDDWSRNNYPTGGAGAIATRFPLDTRIKDAVLALPSR